MFNLFRDKHTPDQALALTGLFQAAAMCHQLAAGLKLDDHEFATTIESLFVLAPKKCTDCYPGLHLGTGLKYFREFLEKKRSRELLHTYRYVLGLIRVKRLLEDEYGLDEMLDNRLAVASEKMRFFNDPENELLLKFLAEVYQDTFGQLEFRIQVAGKTRSLQEEDRVNKIRAILLAGVRSVVLWEQVGGNLFKLFFFRQRYLDVLPA